MTQRIAFCTIITSDYIPFALSLHESLCANSGELRDMFVLFSDWNEVKEGFPKVDGVHYLGVQKLCDNGIGQRIREEYQDDFMDGFRWSMKPVLINYIIKSDDFLGVVFLDSDTFFFNSYDSALKAFESNRVLLTPHWRSSDPWVDPLNFDLLFSNGLFNAGFVGVRKDAVDIMNWWANACLYRCVTNPDKGFFVDQAYLNLFPVLFAGVQVLRHRGFNVANWNQVDCRREANNKGKVLINGEYPVVFIHFTRSTVHGILRGEDAMLLPYLERYEEALMRNGLKNRLRDFYNVPSYESSENRGRATEIGKGKLNRWINRIMKK